jgi:hypothetical protein
VALLAVLSFKSSEPYLMNKSPCCQRQRFSRVSGTVERCCSSVGLYLSARQGRDLPELEEFKKSRTVLREGMDE